jgi:hypothetical protein
MLVMLVSIIVLCGCLVDEQDNVTIDSEGNVTFSSTVEVRDDTDGQLTLANVNKMQQDVVAENRKAGWSIDTEWLSTSAPFRLRYTGSGNLYATTKFPGAEMSREGSIFSVSFPASNPQKETRTIVFGRSGWFSMGAEILGPDGQSVRRIDLGPAAATYKIVLSESSARTAAAQRLKARLVLEAQLMEEERQRNVLEAALRSNRVEWAALAVKDFGSWLKVNIALACLSGAVDQAQTEGSAGVPAVCAGILAFACADDDDCRAMAVHVFDLLLRAHDLQTKIDAITNDVGRRVVVSNQCQFAVRLAAVFKDSSQPSPGGLWTPIAANTRTELDDEDKMPIRLHTGVIDYYAESTDAARTVNWGGSTSFGYGGLRYSGREATLKPGTGDSFELVLTCGP